MNYWKSHFASGSWPSETLWLIRVVAIDVGISDDPHAHAPGNPFVLVKLSLAVGEEFVSVSWSGWLLFQYRGVGYLHLHCLRPASVCWLSKYLQGSLAHELEVMITEKTAP